MGMLDRLIVVIRIELEDRGRLREMIKSVLRETRLDDSVVSWIRCIYE
jgi:hypothetical protein